MTDRHAETAGTPPGTRLRSFRTDQQFLGLQIAILIVIVLGMISLRETSLGNRQNGLDSRTVQCTNVALHDVRVAQAMPECKGHISPAYYQFHPAPCPTTVSCHVPPAAKPSVLPTR